MRTPSSECRCACGCSHDPRSRGWRNHGRPFVRRSVVQAASERTQPICRHLRAEAFSPFPTARVRPRANYVTIEGRRRHEESTRTRSLGRRKSPARFKGNVAAPAGSLPLPRPPPLWLRPACAAKVNRARLGAIRPGTRTAVLTGGGLAAPTRKSRHVHTYKNRHTDAKNDPTQGCTCIFMHTMMCMHMHLPTAIVHQRMRKYAHTCTYGTSHMD